MNLRMVVIISFLIIIIFGGIIFSLYQPFILVKLIQKLIPEIVFYIPNKHNYFSLTFDDGPNPPYTAEILDILKKYKTKATFFLIGSNVEKHPEYVNKIRSEGHQVANHTYQNGATLFLNKKEFVESLDKTEFLIKQDWDHKIFRPGGGWISRKQIKIAREKGYQIILGSAYVSDPHNPFKWYMLNALKSMLRPGSIVALHDGGGNRKKVVELLPELLEYAKSKNLKSVTLQELMKK